MMPTDFSAKVHSDLMAISSENTYPAQIAWLMIDIASGDIEDRDPTPSPEGKDPDAVSP